MYRIGLIGTGYWGANIAASFEATGEAVIRWLCDAELGRTHALAVRRPGVLTTDRLADVLEDPAVDAVAISTPTTTHYRIALAALAAGKHVFVEKPVTAASAEALDLARAAQAARRTLLVGHVFEYSATIAAVKQAIDGGELGDIHYYNFERTNLGPVRTDVNALWDLASHDISIMCKLADAAPVDVTTAGQSYLNRGIEDVVFATFSFADGAKAHVHASWLNPRKVRQMTVVGSRKMLVWDDLDLQAPIRIYDKRADIADAAAISGDFLDHKVRLFDGGVYIPNVAQNRPLQAECEHFLRCIETGSRPTSDGWSGFRVVRVLEAAEASMRRNSTIVSIELPELMNAA